MSQPRLTVAIIAQNDAEHLRQLLPQLAWADEVLVVDGGSHDDTGGVARRAGARVCERPFDTFAAQRNAALDEARGDWVLSIDCDERPTARLPGAIREASGRRDTAGWRVPIRSCIFGRRFRFSGTQDDRPVRLLRRDAARWHGAVHERLRVAGRIGTLAATLEHHTLPTLASFLAKMERYTSLEAAARVEANRAPRRRDAWLRPALEVGRRLLWKQGWLDGPEGWAFCTLSGLSEWVLHRKHVALWRDRAAVAAWRKMEEEFAKKVEIAQPAPTRPLMESQCM